MFNRMETDSAGDCPGRIQRQSRSAFVVSAGMM